MKKISALYLCLALTALMVFALLAPALADRHEEREHEEYSGAATDEGQDEAPGQETTGVLALLLFSLANIPVAVSLAVKGANRWASPAPELKSRLTGFNRRQKGWLMRLHYWLNPPALLMALVHAILYSQVHVLPFLGLVAAALLVALGFVIRYKLAPLKLRPRVYRLHAKPYLAGAMLLLLVVGHLLI